MRRIFIASLPLRVVASTSKGPSRRALATGLEGYNPAQVSMMEEMCILVDAEDNVLRNAPHTAREVGGDEWSHPYPRSQAAWPAQGPRDHKYWPTVGRVDDAYGDRNLVCACPPWGEADLDD